MHAFNTPPKVAISNCNRISNCAGIGFGLAVDKSGSDGTLFDVEFYSCIQGTQVHIPPPPPPPAPPPPRLREGLRCGYPLAYHRSQTIAHIPSLLSLRVSAAGLCIGSKTTLLFRSTTRRGTRGAARHHCKMRPLSSATSQYSTRAHTQTYALVRSVLECAASGSSTTSPRRVRPSPLRNKWGGVPPAHGGIVIGWRPMLALVAVVLVLVALLSAALRVATSSSGETRVALLLVV
jgi:hypothetical protein